jgi:tetratricopeptide (TPR) repeat protein
MIAQTVTRNDGDFAFTSLFSGEYEVAVTIAGYEPAAEVVRFSDNSRMNLMEVQTVEIRIRPRPENAILGPPGTNFAQEVPSLARSGYEKALAKLREGKTDEGVALLREAITGFPDYFDAHLLLGKELFREGKNEEALEEFERARQINDRQDAVFFMFGLVMLKQQKFVIAEYGFREAIRLNPNNAGSHFYRGVTLISAGLRGSDQKQRAADLAEAEKELNSAFDMSNKRLSAVYFQRARIYEYRGEKLAAARELESYLKAEPGVQNAEAIRALILKLKQTK